MSPKYPLCRDVKKDSSPCATIVVDPASDDPLDRDFCAYHGNLRRDAHPEAVEAAPDEPPPAVPDAASDDAGPFASFSAPAVSSCRGSPREELRKLAEASTEQLGRFFQDALNAEQKVWTDCPSCRKRSLVPVPAWPARTRAVELLLEQGFGKPEAAPSSEERDDAALAAALERAIEEMSEWHKLEVTGLSRHQKAFLSRPLVEQMALQDANAAEVVAIGRKHGYVAFVNGGEAA